ncbi:MAG TPA: nucleotidyltransferase family protein, partial [Candidatus Acidoferrum sp.]|nr:nucleotidyltransferase family protein [Candidatus Acidoferrum sp.]
MECCSPQPDSARIEELLGHPPNWDALFKLAAQHGVLAHLATRLNHLSDASIPVEARKALQELHRTQIIHTLRITAELLRLVTMLQGEKMELPVVKGPVLSARAYGDAGRRQYGDLDFLARQEDIARITRLMEKAGYKAVVPLVEIEAGRIPG